MADELLSSLSFYLPQLSCRCNVPLYWFQMSAQIAKYYSKVSKCWLT